MTKCWRVAESWTATTDTTISLTVGDVIIVVDSDSDPEWWYGYPEKKKTPNGSVDAISGYFPSNYLEEVDRSSIRPAAPPPPPVRVGIPPPPPVARTPVGVSSSSISSSPVQRAQAAPMTIPSTPPLSGIAGRLAPPAARLGRSAPPPPKFGGGLNNTNSNGLNGSSNGVSLPPRAPSPVQNFTPVAPSGPLPSRSPSPGNAAVSSSPVPRPPMAPRPTSITTPVAGSPRPPSQPLSSSAAPVSPFANPTSPPQQAASYDPAEAAKIQSLLNEFDREGGMPPLRPNSKLLMQGLLNKKCSMKIQVRHFWLFDDQLFYAKDVEDKCTQQGQLGKKWQLKRIHPLDVNFDVVRLPSKGSFKILSTEKPLILFADDALAREVWVNALLEQMKVLKIPTQTLVSTRPEAKASNSSGSGTSGSGASSSDDVVFPTGPMPDWDLKQVTNWLKLKGYYSMVPMFSENQINGQIMIGIDDRYLKDTLGILDDKIRERWLRDHANALSSKRPGAGSRRSQIVGVGSLRQAPSSSSSSSSSFDVNNSAGNSTLNPQRRPNGIPAPSPHRAGAAPVPGIPRTPQRPGSAPPAPFIQANDADDSGDWNDEAMGVPAVPVAGSGPPPRPPPRNSFCRRYAAGDASANAAAPRGAGRPLATGGGGTGIGAMGGAIGGMAAAMGAMPRRAPVPGFSSIRQSSSADDIAAVTPAGGYASNMNSSNHMRNSSTASTSSSSSSSSLTAAMVEQWSVDQVCEWLKELNLDKYDGAFRREQVDGSVLLALTDKILEEDFGMSGLHRTRFLLKLGPLQK